MNKVAAPESKPATRTPGNAIQMVWVGLALLVAFAPTLQQIVGSWFDERIDMGHGLFVPFAAAYMIWLKRDALSKLPAEPSGWGTALTLVAAIQWAFATIAQWGWMSRIAFLISLVGCILALYGALVLKELAYPLCTLVLMIPPPSFIYERITLPLQLLASRLGEVSLETLGYSVLREGNILQLVGERLAVEEACSGIRSLMSLFFLCLIYVFFFVPEKAIRAVLLVAVVPIAIICNAGRIVATGIVGQYDRDLAHGMLHAAFGHLSLVLGATLCLLLHYAIRMSRKWLGPAHA